jgi:predicted PhzF superfamily epimerase YddE/YHI9
MAEFPADGIMQALAAENNLAETAFLVPDGADYRLRWFTPAVEVPLCGHATLASAAVVMQRLEPARRQVVFHTKSGPLTVVRTDLGYRMDLPARPSEIIPAPAGFAEMLGAEPVEVALNQFNYLVRLDSPAAVRALAPDLRAIAALDRPGVIVTAQGEGACDFTSRYFAPAKGIDEDPVTGAAHCMLAPYWAQRLGKTRFRAFQASRRGGEILCEVKGERVELEGAVVFYLEGQVEL